MPDQGLMSFPGVGQILGGTFTFSHGITPSIALIEVAPQNAPLGEIGTLEIRFGGITIRFPNSLLDANTLQIDGNGTVWRVEIMDRRWKWQFGEIIGHYNLRNKDGELIEATKKTPQQLATLLLEAMREVGFNVADLPNDVFPEVHWDDDNPAQMLAELVEELGCRIILTLTNVVTIRKTGAGAPLPATADLISKAAGINPPNLPDAVKAVCGPDQFQFLFKLEPYGKDLDGKWKPIDKLSYKPAAGWSFELPGLFSGVSDPKALLLAEKTVFKCYKATKSADNNLTFPVIGEIEDIEQLLPLDDLLLETFVNEEGEQERKPAIIWGQFYDGEEQLANTEEGTEVKTDWVLDGPKGLVTFSEYMYRYDRSASEAAIAPANIYLHATCEYVMRPKRGKRRLDRSLRIPGAVGGVGNRIVKKYELNRKYIISYARTSSGGVGARQVSGIVSNEETLTTYLRRVLNAIIQEYQTLFPEDIVYAGIKQVTPDGAIQQVSWTVGAAGATTRASRNTEHDVLVPAYKVRRNQEKLRKVLE